MAKKTKLTTAELSCVQIISAKSLRPTDSCAKALYNLIYVALLPIRFFQLLNMRMAASDNRLHSLSIVEISATSKRRWSAKADHDCPILYASHTRLSSITTSDLHIARRREGLPVKWESRKHEIIAQSYLSALNLKVLSFVYPLEPF